MRTNLTIASMMALAAVLASCEGSGPPTSSSEAGAPLEEACISTEEVDVYVPYQGTVVFSVVPEGLPEGAEIVEFAPCLASSQPCDPPAYYVPCAVAGPTVCSPGQQYEPACWHNQSCPSARNPVLFTADRFSCPLTPPEPWHFFTTVRCADGTVVERLAVVWVTLPGDCDGNGSYTDEEINTVIDAVFDTTAESCDADLNLDGRITPNEVQRVVELAGRERSTGNACPIPEPTPTPVQG